MFSVLKKIFSQSETELIHQIDDTKLTINLPLNARNYLKRISTEDWNQDKNIDYNNVESIDVNDELSYYPNDRYAPELKFFKTGYILGDGLISVTNSSILFEIFWIAYNSKWRYDILSKGKVVEKNRNFIKVEFYFNKEKYYQRINDEFVKLSDTLRKKYTPKSKWELTFQLDRKITKRDISKIILSVNYDDTTIKSYIERDLTSFCKFNFILGDDDIIKNDIHSHNSKESKIKLARSITSNVELDIEFKRLGKRDLHLDWKEDEWFYKFTFSPQRN